MTIIDDILRREGSTFTDHPADKGGPTRYGITQAKLAEWFKHPVTREDVEHLSETVARDIYRVDFIAPWGFISSPRLREFLIDTGVNHGVSRAKRLLQRALGVAEDGDIGTVTRNALANIDGETLRLRVIAERIKFYGRIVDADHTQAIFIEGWLNRAAEFLY
jgi:lysozyme family protein